MANELIRTPTTEEKMDFIDISEKDRESAKAKFEEELAKKGQEAMKKGLPFAEKAARDEFKDLYDEQVKASVRKNGYFNPLDVKPIRINLSKFMNLDNFTLVEEGEVADSDLSQKNPGLHVTVAFKKYNFKGYANTYTVMEDGISAVQRAQEKRRKLDEGK